LLKLGVRAFAVPLLVLLALAAAASHWHFAVGQDWIGVGALVFAAWCGWRATRSLRRDSANEAQTK
jgi:uncharacterized membrane protein YphA (DoxX/SURF4 family)